MSTQRGCFRRALARPRPPRQYAFRLINADFAIIEKHAKKLSAATKTEVSHAAALRSILHWFRDESPVTMTEIDAHIHAVRKERREKEARHSHDSDETCTDVCPLHVGPPPGTRIK